MTEFLLAELPYHPDSTILFDKVADEPWSVFLDSNQPASTQGRYDIIAAKPNIRLITKNNKTKIQTWSESFTVPGDPFAILEEHLSLHKKYSLKLPFIGGALGFFNYDLGRYIEKIPNKATDDLSLPDMAMGIYSWVIVVDHKNKKTNLVGDKLDTKTRRNWGDLVRTFSEKPSCIKRAEFNVKSSVTSNMSEEDYGNAFQRIKNYIREGDCYQVNLAQRFSVSVEGSPWLAYQALRKINSSPFSAYMNYPDFQILSNSPERFLSVKDRVVQTKPIKGTRPRSNDKSKDQSLMQELQDSKKDQAENVMIVDLLRNDISKNCALGSVQVTKLFDIESFPNVHHMVSTITGQLRDQRSTIDLLRGCFPGGSITGAPKLRSMEIIEELEPHRRGIYCGSIGYIGFDGNMDTNIAIRTIVHKDQSMHFYAGGGIVYDSQVNSEYQETFDKAASIMQLFNPGKSYAMGH
jgi:para-aminobenzoate synthetase component 1